MNSEQRKVWIESALQEVLHAMIKAEKIRDALIFKGARILNLHLGGNRESLDIDSNLAPELVALEPEGNQQKAFFEKNLPPALFRYFEQQQPVRFSLESVRVDKKPARGHPRGWMALQISIRIKDHHYPADRSLPAIEIDVAAPESLGASAVELMPIHGIETRVYSLQRIAGEKLRAYLTSLSAYRRKMKSTTRAFRVKDLYDIARILRARSIRNKEFWHIAAGEFQLACESRLVDCEGLDTFMQDWNLARERYLADESLRDIDFSEAEETLKQVVECFSEYGIFPLRYPV